MRLRTIQLINECGSDLAGTSYHPAVTVYRLPVYLLCGYLTSWLKGLPHLDYLESSRGHPRPAQRVERSVIFAPSCNPLPLLSAARRALKIASRTAGAVRDFD